MVIRSFSASLLAGLLTCFSGVAMSADAAWKLHVDSAEAGKFDAAEQANFEKEVAAAGCPLQLVQQKSEEAEILFAVRPGVAEGRVEWLKPRTWNDLPLTTAVVVHANTGVGSLQSLSGAAVGVISDGSHIGYEVAQKMFSAAGATLDRGKLSRIGSYDNASVLLQHQDIFAAVLPGPLARRWSQDGSLMVVAESAPLAIGSLQLRSNLNPDQVAKCKSVFTGLKGDGFRKVFPLWVEGFREP